MTPLDKLKSILGNQYQSEDGETYKVRLLAGMTEKEIDTFRNTLPNRFLPKDIDQLLAFSKGFEFYGLEEIRFDSTEFGFEEVFPYSIQLAGDGFGNFWVLDVDSKGHWGEVYYVCHDPAVIVKHSTNLTQFIKHVDEYGRTGADSNLDIIHEKVVMDIWENKAGIMESNEKDYQFPEDILRQLSEMFLVADLTDQPIRTGFAWGKYGANTTIIRVEDKAVWIVEKKVKQGFLARLFNRQK
jgi:hypothetical protein